VNRRAALLALSILVVALIFRVLSAEGFWIDEVFSGANANAGPSSFGERRMGEPHSPWPVYYGLLALWMKVVPGVTGLKSLSVALSLAGVAALGLLARSLFGERAGWIAAGLAAVNPMLAWYGGEARMYVLWLLAFTGALAAAFRADGRDRYADGVLFAAAGCLTVYAHVFGAFAVTALGVYVLIRGGRRTRIGLVVGTLLFLAPAVPVVMEQASHWLAWKGSSGPENYLAGPGNLIAAALALFTAYAVPLQGFSAVRVGAALLVLPAAGLPLVIAIRARLPRTRLLLIVALVALVAPYLLMIRTLMFSPRFALLALPPLLLVVAAGLDRSTQRLRVAAATALGLLGVACLVGRADRTDWREVATVLEAERKAGETLTFTGGNLIALREWFGTSFAGEDSDEAANWTIRFPRERPAPDGDTWVFGSSKQLIEDEPPVLRRHR